MKLLKTSLSNDMKLLKTSLKESLLDDIEITLDHLDPIDIIFTSKTENEFLERKDLYIDTLDPIDLDIDKINKGKYVLYKNQEYGLLISKMGSTRTMSIQFINIPRFGICKVDNSNIRKRIEKFSIFNSSNPVGYYIQKSDFDKFIKYLNK